MSSNQAADPARPGSDRNVILHAMTVYYDGNAELAEKLLSRYDAERDAAKADTEDTEPHPYTRGAFDLLVQAVENGDMAQAWEGFRGFVKGVVAGTRRGDARLLREHVADDQAYRPKYQRGMREGADLIESQTS